MTELAGQTERTAFDRLDAQRPRCCRIEPLAASSTARRPDDLIARPTPTATPVVASERRARNDVGA